jgi:SWI/SNF-related matrix-associated actin-dependent regulator of chromatin subfamily A3
LNLQIREDPLTYREDAIHDARDNFIQLEITFVGGYCWMSLRDAVNFGCLNQKISQVLKCLTTLPNVEAEGVVSWASLEKARAEWKKSGRSANLLVDLNIYGPSTAKLAKSAGKILGNAKLFLQPPSFITRPVTYDNPQYLKLPNALDMQVIDVPSTKFAVPLSEIAKEATHVELESVLDSIPQSKFLREASTNWRIRTVLKRCALTIMIEDCLPTLKSYQREAVDFLNRRETGDLPSSLSLWKPHDLPRGASWYVFHIRVAGFGLTH